VKNYQEIFQKNSITTAESKKALKGLGNTKFFRKIINTIVGGLWILLLLGVFFGGGKGTLEMLSL
jgi:hypothetical protein